MKIKINIKLSDFKVNKIIRGLIVSDMVFLGGWGLIGPIFAVFIIENISGATIITVGAVSALYWIVKSIVQIPVAIFIDRMEGEKDDFYALILGLMLCGFAAVLFLLAKTITGLFVVEFIHAAGMGFFVPSWSALFSRHLDKDRCAYNWSLNSTLYGFTYAGMAFFGGIIAKVFGFEAVFIFVGFLSFLSAFILFSVPHLIFPKVKNDVPPQFIDQHMPPHTLK